MSALSEGVTGGVSAGASAISTMGGVTGNQNDANTAGDYNSSNPSALLKNQGKKDSDLFRKGSSMSANRNHFQINTPSALGYTSVLFGGVRDQHGSAGRTPGMINFNYYGNMTVNEEEKLRT